MVLASPVKACLKTPVRDTELGSSVNPQPIWVAQGKANADIGAILSVGESTVKKHLEHIFKKLQVENRSAASLLAMKALTRAVKTGRAPAGR